jgi:phage terminase small subunit
MGQENLTDKQIRFCEEYLIDLNATQAAIRAGYSEKTAGSIGDENLKKPEIKEFIKLKMYERSKRTEITSDMVIQELAKIGFSDIKNYYNSDEAQIEITQLDNKYSAAVSQFKVTETEWEGGRKVVKEFKLHDKVKALEDLGKHLGVFEKDNKQKKPDLSGLALTINKVVTKDVNGRNRDKDNS